MKPSLVFARPLLALSIAALSVATTLAGDQDSPSNATADRNPGRVVEVVPATEPNKGAGALTMNDETLSCALREGQTTFVIKLPTATPLDRFTFVNENAAAAGELAIYVSNDQLPAASEKWTAVDGRIAFSHKRRFNLSMVGVEARYVKLDFRVASGARTASRRTNEQPMLVANR